MKLPALILNPRSRLNKSTGAAVGTGNLKRAEPSTHPELLATLCDYARQEVDLLIVSGGDRIRLGPDTRTINPRS